MKLLAALAVLTFISSPAVAQPRGKALGLQTTVQGIQIEKQVWETGSSRLKVKDGAHTAVVEIANNVVIVTVNGVTARFANDATNSQSRMNALARMVRSSKALTSYRLVAAKLSQRLLTEHNEGELLPFVAQDESIIIDGTILDSLAGDLNGALTHVHGWLKRRGLGFRRAQQVDCVTNYERTINSYFSTYESCLDAALSMSGKPWYYAGAIPMQQAFCVYEYTARSQAAWWQFISCTTIKY